ncbi:NAD(P)H-hydrate dehydratase [Candidatus Gottesmanbacteria bacterium]|nr:NAD(P)H-hydrate dehydratase [Candidatus Gottesmanbacteria bacterium]
MVRTENAEIRNPKSLPSRQAGEIRNLKEIIKIENEGVQTYYLTKYLLEKYPKKKWVIDAGALQMMELSWIPHDAILTPHQGEFERLLSKITNYKLQITNKSQISNLEIFKQDISMEEKVKLFARTFNCTVLLKGERDIVCTGKCEGNVCLPTECGIVEGGNAGMTKGGTGDVLAGMVAALYTKNEAFLAAAGAAFVHKRAGEDLYTKNGYWYNASDLTDQIPQTMKRLFFL